MLSRTITAAGTAEYASDTSKASCAFVLPDSVSAVNIADCRSGSAAARAVAVGPIGTRSPTTGWSASHVTSMGAASGCPS